MAGILTYSILGGLPINSIYSDQRFAGTFLRSLQQRVCSGFAPDSLFIAHPVIGLRDTITGTKVEKIIRLTKKKKN